MEPSPTLRPGFMVVHGNRMETLRGLAVEWLRRHPLGPLENETLLVQSNGIAQWLRLALARDPDDPEPGLGIAAALDIQLPSRFLWSAYRAVLGPEAVPTASPFDKEALTWRLMRLLPDLAGEPAFAPLAGFLADDPDGRKRHELAGRLADLLDQYQVYRADWLAAWAEGRDEIPDARGQTRPVPPDQAWQPALWRALLADLPPESAATSRATIHTRFREAAARLTERPAGLPRRVVVFGISSLPQQALEALEGVARVSQVLLCVHNPCEHYWADIVADRDLLRAAASRHARRPGMPAELDEADLHAHAHPLLAAWGKQGRDYVRLLDEHDEPSGYRDLFEALPWQRIDLFDSPGGDTLLHQLQDDIRDLRPPAETRAAWPPMAGDDDSLRFHVCHGPQREVEILHDQLLARFDADPTLRPRDVIVMVPDIERYAPHIRAVFGRLAADDPRHLPFTISDQGQRGRAPVLVALEQLLQLPRARSGVGELLDLLDVAAVRQRLGLTAADLNRLHRWAEGAGIRWGLDGDQRAGLGLPATDGHTWAFGLRRMLLGYAAGDSGPWNDIEPFAEVGGLEAAAAGPLADLVERLRQWRTALSQPRPPAEWGTTLRALLADFLEPVEEDDRLTLVRLEEALEAWEARCEEAGLDEALPLTVVREHWLAAVDETGLAQRFLAGAVNFATLMPMRAIPFRVVCLLGMEDGAYPRTPVPADFDLMNGDYRPGDRSRREDDRYLFLEALLSARDHLHISWAGRSIRDDSEQPPSVLVGQLRDHLAAGWTSAAGDDLLETLTVVHPLQPFSRANFPADDTGPLFTYAHEWAPAAGGPGPGAAEPERLPPPTGAQLGIGELVAFWKNPVRALFHDRLRTRLEEPEAADEDVEPFGLDGLTAWQLRRRLVAGNLPAAADETAREAGLDAGLQRLARAGELPDGLPGQRAAEALHADAGALLETLGDAMAGCTAPAEEPLELAFTSGEVTVTGWLPGLRRDAAGFPVRLAWEVSRLAQQGPPYRRLDRLAEPWIAHLLACAGGTPLTTLFFCPADKPQRGRTPIATLQLLPLGAGAAADHLTALLGAWVEGQQQPLPVTARTAIAALEAEGSEKVTPADAAARAYAGDGHNQAGEMEGDPHLRRTFPDADDLLGEAFDHWRDALYRPLFDSVRRPEDEEAAS
ncbi:MAG: exodeoxyribonuclease V subunit gamma [Pseudomonadota bacterium]